MSKPNTSSENSFFLNTDVKKRKDYALKERLRALILAKGISEPEFYKSLDMCRQYWYAISYNIEEPKTYLKIKIAQSLGVDTRAIWEDRGKNE